MYKLQYYDTNLALQNSLALDSFETLSLKNNLGSFRELKAFVTTDGLDTNYDKIVNNDNHYLYLELDGFGTMFEKVKTSFSHLLPVGSTGQGTNENTLILIDSSVAGNYATQNINNVIYMVNTDYIGTENRYKIYGVDNATDKQALYNKGATYLDSFEDNSKEQVLDKDTLDCTINYISMGFARLKYSIRQIPFNKVYNGTVLGFLQDLTSEIEWVMLTGDRSLISFDTGIFDNYDLFEEVMKKISNLTYRDAGFNFSSGKPMIEIANFTKLTPNFIMSNYQNSHDFYSQTFQYETSQDNYPSVTIKYKANSFVPEGSVVNFRYKKTITTKTGTKIVMPSENKNLIYQGQDFINISEYNI